MNESISESLHPSRRFFFPATHTAKCDSKILGLLHLLCRMLLLFPPPFLTPSPLSLPSVKSLSSLTLPLYCSFKLASSLLLWPLPFYSPKSSQRELLQSKSDLVISLDLAGLRQLPTGPVSFFPASPPPALHLPNCSSSHGVLSSLSLPRALTQSIPFLLSRACFFSAST